MASWFRSLAQTFTGVASEDFNVWLADNYDDVSAELPRFEETAFAEAAAKAREGGGLLLVWFHTSRGPLTDALVREVWASAGLRQCIDEGRLLCWAGDVSRREPAQLAQNLRVARFPAVALLRPLQARSDRPGWPQFMSLFAAPAEIGPRHLMAELQRGLQRDAQERELRKLAHDMMAQMQQAQQQAHHWQQQTAILRQQEAEEAPLFCTLFESQYSDNHPSFCDLSFEGAMGQARRDGKLLLAWLRLPSNEVVDAAFGELLWANEVVQAFIAEHFLAWVGDVERWLGASQLQQVLQLPSNQLPALVAFEPLSVNDVDGVAFLFGRVLEGAPYEHPAGTAWRVAGYLPVSCPQALGDDCCVVTEFLCGLSERWEAKLVASEHERRERAQEAEAWRSLREQQDAEFEESLRRDQERQRHRDMHTQDDAVIVPSGPSALELARREAALLLASKALPESGSVGVCTIVVRLPTGRRLQRLFYEDDTVAMVYNWVQCAAQLEAIASNVGSDPWQLPPSFEVPESFLLCMTFPRQPLLDQELTLRLAGLCPNAILALSPSD